MGGTRRWTRGRGRERCRGEAVVGSEDPEGEEPGEDEFHGSA